MTRNLTNSKLDRQNILNNEFAISTIQDQTKITGIMFEGRIRFTKSMVAKYFNVDVRTIERYISDNLSEISQNGYEIIRGARLKESSRAIDNSNAPDIDVGSISNRTSQISLFDFKAFLNIAMLLVESESARVIRQIILDIIIDLINQKTGGKTKYINQRDQDFITAFYQDKYGQFLHFPSAYRSHSPFYLCFLICYTLDNFPQK